MIELYPPKVKLNDEHRYFHISGQEYMGFSRLFDTFLCKPFNPSAAAYGVAKKEGVTAQSILDRWDDQRKEGVRIDNALDLYWNTKTYRQEDEDIIDGVREVLKIYEEYHESYGQLVLYSEKYRVAGMCDRLSMINSRKDCPIVMSDFKCFEKEIEHMPKGGQRFLNAPFDHMVNTKYSKICFQLSFYSYLFEELTGRPPIRQFIHWIDPRTIKKVNGELNVRQALIPVPYLKSDVMLFLETYKQDIINLTLPAAAISAF